VRFGTVTSALASAQENGVDCSLFRFATLAVFIESNPKQVATNESNMPFISECPSCGEKLSIPDNLAGKKVRCSRCATVFAAQAITEQAPLRIRPAPQKSQSGSRIAREAEKYPVEPEPRPLRRSNRIDADASKASGRAGLLLTFGILSIVAPLVAIVMQVIAGLVFPPLGLCGIVFVVVGMVLGIMAWVMGSGDLKLIRAGVIDRSAEGRTRGGFITGIIGTALNISYFICGCVAVILAFVVGGAIAAALGIAAAKQAQMMPKPVPGKQSTHFTGAGLSQYLPRRIDLPIR
jgi:hypothetical protein